MIKKKSTRHVRCTSVYNYGKLQQSWRRDMLVRVKPVHYIRSISIKNKCLLVLRNFLLSNLKFWWISNIYDVLIWLLQKKKSSGDMKGICRNKFFDFRHLWQLLIGLLHYPCPIWQLINAKWQPNWLDRLAGTTLLRYCIDTRWFFFPSHIRQKTFINIMFVVTARAW